jgi:hypothetical protein
MKEITAYDALHIRFDGFSCLTESLIEKVGKVTGKQQES